MMHIAGFGAFTWVGLYLLLRATRHTPLIMAGVVCLFAQAAFFASGVLKEVTTDRSFFLLLERGFWWSAVVPIAVWFHFSSLMVQQVHEQASLRTSASLSPVVVAVYSVAGALILVGTLSNLITDYSSTTLLTDRTFAVYPGPAYSVYMVYNGTVALGALVSFVRALHGVRQSRQRVEPALVQQLKLLVGGALLFLSGAVLLPAGYNWNVAILRLSGYLCLFLGLAIVGYGIAHAGLLLQGQHIQRDFIYNFTGIILLNILYIGLVILTGQGSIPLILVLVGMVILTHTTFDNGRAILDRFFFSQDERIARAEARDYATVLGTAPVSITTASSGGMLPAAEQPEEDQPDEFSTDEAAAQPVDSSRELPVPKHFKDSVRKAVTNLKNPPLLATSSLLGLRLVEQRLVQAELEDNRLNRATLLRELLIEYIEALRPGDDALSYTADAWRFYNVLYYPYVRAISRKSAITEVRRLSEGRQRAGQHEAGELEQVLAWIINVDENTFYKWQRRASDTIATMLWEGNRKAETETSDGHL